MKRLLLLLLGGMLCGASAFAAAPGVDLSFNACPLNAGSTQAGVIDCTGGGALTALVTFAPAEAITDLVAFDTIVDVHLQAGDIGTDANFWDFQAGNASAVSANHLKPAAGCNTPTAYANTWNTPGAGATVSALVRSPRDVRLSAGSHRPDGFAAAAGQNLFGYQLTFDGSSSVEAGGSASGCSVPTIVVVESAAPRSGSGAPTTAFGNCSPSNNPEGCSAINGAVPIECCGLPVQRRTWSQLKSLYR